MRRIDTACSSGLSVNAGQPASKRGQVAIASPESSSPRSAQENARWPGECPGTYSTCSGPTASPSPTLSSIGTGRCFGRLRKIPTWNGYVRNGAVGFSPTDCAGRSPEMMSASHSCASTAAPVSRFSAASPPRCERCACVSTIRFRSNGLWPSRRIASSTPRPSFSKSVSTSESSPFASIR